MHVSLPISVKFAKKADAIKMARKDEAKIIQVLTLRFDTATHISM